MSIRDNLFNNYQPEENEIVFSTDRDFMQSYKEQLDKMNSSLNIKKFKKLSSEDLQKAILLVCQSLYIDVPKAVNIDSTICKKLLQNGIVLAPECYTIRELPILLPHVVSKYGYDLKQLNQTFHASFQDIIDKTDAELLEEQALHYLNAYETGIVFRPSEWQELPKIEGDAEVSFKYIKALNKEQLTVVIQKVVSSGIALSKEVLKAIKDIIITLDIRFDFDLIKNKELQIQLYDYYNIVPKSVDKFLRYAIYKLLDKSLMIKDRQTLIGLKFANKADKDNLLLRFFERTTEEEVAKVFFRYKKFFLAMKTDTTANIINRIRRKADKLHIPAKKKVLDILTSGEEIDINEIKKELKNVTLYKKFSILNALSTYLYPQEKRLYHIRNGSAFMKDAKNISKERKIILTLLYDFIYNNVLEEIRPLVKNKVIYIPSNLKIAVPTSEKQFFGNIPFGTRLDLGKQNSIVAIHWFGEGIDLDLHCTSENYHIGWNSMYNFEDEVLFSGDLVTAPKPLGATEAVFIDENVKNEIFSFNINVFAGSEEQEFSFMLDTMERPLNRQSFRKYVIDNRSMLTHTVVKTKDFDNIVGLLNVSEDERAFYFMNFSVGNSRIPMKESNKVLLDNVKCQLCLNDVLKDAGAKVVDESIFDKNIDDLHSPSNDSFNSSSNDSSNENVQEETEPITIDINLSLEMMDKTTLLQLFTPDEK